MENVHKILKDGIICALTIFRTYSKLFEFINTTHVQFKTQKFGKIKLSKYMLKY